MKEETKLTIEEIRKRKGLENLSDKEAEEAIGTINKLALMLIKIMKKEIINNPAISRRAKS